MNIEQGGVGIWIAYGAIALFLILLLLVVLRTVVWYALLLVLPAARLLRTIPGMRALVDRLERRAGRGRTASGAGTPPPTTRTE